MTRRSFAWITPVVVAAAGLVGLACSSSNSTGPKLTPQALVGAYTLDTVSTAAGTATPPQVRGTLQLTDSTYIVYVVEQVGAGAGDTVVATSDSGTYTVSGSTFTETSKTGNPPVTAMASLRGNNDTLDVKVTSPAQAAGTFVWVRVP
jgi:hypothetical protein